MALELKDKLWNITIKYLSDEKLKCEEKEHEQTCYQI